MNPNQNQHPGEIPSELALIGSNWPEQIIPDYMPYVRVWREQFPYESKRCRKRYMQILGEWSQHSNGRNLTPHLILEWNRFVLAKGIGATSASKYIRVVRSFLSWLKSVGVITADPSLTLVVIRRPPPKPPRSFTHAEYEQIVALGNSNPVRYALVTWLIVLGYHTGLSLVDCCHLKWESVQLNPNGPCWIKHVRRKMASRIGIRALASIPIIPGSELWVWFQRLLLARRDDNEWVNPQAPVFYDGNDRSEKHLFKRMFARALGWKQLNGRTFKCLRNSFCSRMMNSGCNPVLVSKMTGHSNLSQLAAYVEPDMRSLQEELIKGVRYAEQATYTGNILLPSPLPAASDL